MSFIALVSDSTAALPADLVEEHNIRIVPLYIKIGDATYRDGVDITPQEFYDLLPHTTPLPTTSQPSVGDFAEVFGQLVQEGATGIISVHLSSGISGTVNSATLAAQQFEGVPIEIVDTRCAGASHYLAVEVGARAIAAGASFDEAVAAVRGVVDAQKTVFVVDTLEYLYKGGRIGGAAALLGSMLQFKPLLYFQEGKIDALGRVRKSTKALERIVETMGEWMGDGPLRAVLMQADCPDRAELLTDMVRQQLNVVDVYTLPLTPVLGAHAGNGTIGLCCCPASVCGDAS